MVGPCPHAQVLRFFRALGLVILLALVEVLYALVISAGAEGRWPGYMAYYDLLAEGFRAGHLYLSLEPTPQLLAAVNPFDGRYADYWLGEASLYRGHYYLYWGPLAALVLSAVITSGEVTASTIRVWGVLLTSPLPEAALTSLQPP